MTPSKQDEAAELHLILVARSIEIDSLNAKMILEPDVDACRPIAVAIAKAWVGLEERLETFIAEHYVPKAEVLLDELEGKKHE